MFVTGSESERKHPGAKSRRCLLTSDPASNQGADGDNSLKRQSCYFRKHRTWCALRLRFYRHSLFLLVTNIYLIWMKIQGKSQGKDDRGRFKRIFRVCFPFKKLQNSSYFQWNEPRLKIWNRKCNIFSSYLSLDMLMVMSSDQKLLNKVPYFFFFCF